MIRAASVRRRLSRRAGGYSTVVISSERELICTEGIPISAAAADEYIWLLPMISPFWAFSAK